MTKLYVTKFFHHAPIGKEMVFENLEAVNKYTKQYGHTYVKDQFKAASGAIKILYKSPTNNEYIFNILEESNETFSSFKNEQDFLQKQAEGLANFTKLGAVLKIVSLEEAEKINPFNNDFKSRRTLREEFPATTGAILKKGNMPNHPDANGFYFFGTIPNGLPLRFLPKHLRGQLSKVLNKEGKI